MSVREKMLLEALEWALEYIDAIPSDVELPAMPGFDRDYVDELVAVANSDLVRARANPPIIVALDESGSMSRELAGQKVDLTATLTYPGSRVSDLLLGAAKVQVANKDLMDAGIRLVFTDGEKA